MFAMTDKDNTIILLVFCPEILRKYGLKGEMNKKEVLQKNLPAFYTCCHVVSEFAQALA